MIKMLLSGLIGFVFAVSFGMAAALAGPVLTPGSIDKLIAHQSVNDHLIQVSGCHANKRRHMVYKWGYKAWHRHRRNCQPKHANPPIVHCHRNSRKHRHSGRGKRWHRHAGNGCYYTRRLNRNNGACVKVAGVLICSN